MDIHEKREYMRNYLKKWKKQNHQKVLEYHKNYNTELRRKEKEKKMKEETFKILSKYLDAELLNFIQHKMSSA